MVEVGEGSMSMYMAAEEEEDSKKIPKPVTAEKPAVNVMDAVNGLWPGSVQTSSLA